MESTLHTSVDPKKAAFTNGLIWAAINIALFLVVYYVKPDLMGSFAFMGLSIVIGIGLAVYFCIDENEWNGSVTTQLRVKDIRQGE